MGALHFSSGKAGSTMGILFLSSMLTCLELYSQYFGRNKVNYRDIKFEVLKTPHFEIYEYLNNNSVRNRMAQQMEQWYLMYQQVFRDTFEERNPVILYNTHADFQQTRTIEGMIGVGTGGVTEGLKNRVIMPFMESNAQTDHVLGHELVHAFQYRLLKGSDSLSLRDIGNLPLWMVEGLAEYMSIGYLDPHTAIWMRSAVLENKLPTLKDLNRKPDEYFPYRWGQVFWSYVAGVYGDDIIRKLFIQTARHGYEDALKRVLGVNEKDFSLKWKEALINYYSPFRKNASTAAAGQRLIDKKNAGEINIVPSISPDGNLVAFWTEKDLFNLDLYLADAVTGKIKRKLTSHVLSEHIDEFSSYESSVAWSPDSRQLAFVAFIKGQNRLVISNSQTGRITREIVIPGVPGFGNPAWSPDGKTIVVNGLANGQSDLYAYELSTGQVRQLTNDRYSDVQPAFSPDGKWLVFSTDRESIGQQYMQHQFAHNLALLNLETNAITMLNFFKGANNLNPVFGGDNNIIYFLSDRDGFRNLYQYDITSGQIQQLTNLFTGITGITLYAPAISVARQTGKILYSYYSGDEYAIYSVDSVSLSGTSVDADQVNMEAALLPPTSRTAPDLVQANLNRIDRPLLPETAFQASPYRSKFQLDYIGNTGVGISTSRFGTGLAGGINGIFSDMLGNHQLFGAIALEGEVYDMGGQFAYVNQKKRFNWGVSTSHIPYVSGFESLRPDTLVFNQADTVEVLNYSLDLLRTFEDQVSIFGSYPFSQIKRIEGGAAFARYYYRVDRYSSYYLYSGEFIGSQKQRQPSPKGFNLGQGYIAVVGDNSFFGVASPLLGHRFRLEASKYLGEIEMHSLLGDYRKYFRFAPFTLATRNLYIARFGRDAESGIIPPLFLGFPSLVRGYEAGTFTEEQMPLTINDLLGSKMYVGNIELRLPFTGPERLSLIRSRYLFTELNLFTDGGITWGAIGSPADPKDGTATSKSSRLVLSTGLSIRVNLFGYLIVEPYYAVPWQNGGFKNASFGINFVPGW
ncbi:MAG TPA: hypothetical protein VFO70_04520 [Chitinophagaceae bacterium]|nr:hypothetical protein [Chitinophagaceae bacterium]